MFDSHKNFAYSTVATAPSPPTSGTSLTVATGDGSKFPTPPFNATVWPNGVQPTTANAEIVRVTAISTDTFTITRTQEGTSARSITIGDQIAATITVKTLTDVETSINTQISEFRPFEQHYGSGINATQWPGNASVGVFPVTVPFNASFRSWFASVSLSISSSSNSSHAGTLSMQVGFYTRNVSTLNLVSSGSTTYAWTNTSNDSTASLSGIREVSGDFVNLSLTRGIYWIGFWSRTSTANANWFTASNIVLGTSQSNTSHSGLFRAAAAVASFQPGVPGQGTWSTTSANLPDTMAFSHITGTARWWYRPHIAFRNY